MSRAVFPVAALVCLGLFVPEAQSADAALRVERSITYSSPGGEKLQLDIAIPAGDGPFPCVVCFHGGAWMGGSRKDLSGNGRGRNGEATPSWIEVIAQHGYVAASISYRLAPKNKFPAMIEDARSAIRYLRANAKNYKIDPDRVAALGFSAGGHLALLAGLCDKSAGFDIGENLDYSGQVQCIVDFFGPTDIAMYAKSEGLEDGYLVPVFGKKGKTDASVYKKASPITYVNKDAPPTLLLHGTFDLIVPVKHSETMHKALTGAGATAEIFTVSFAGHGGWNDRDMTKAQSAVFKFLDEHLKGKK